MLRFFIFFVISALSIRNAFSQSDSLVYHTDTVIVIKEPFVVKKQIFLGDGAGEITVKKKRVKMNQEKTQTTWSAGLSVLYASTTFPDTKSMLKPEIVPGFQNAVNITYHPGKVYFNVGIGMFTSRFSSSEYVYERKTRPGTIKVYDYSNASTIILPGRIIFEGVTSKDSAIVEEYDEITEKRTDNRISYIYIPASIAYRFNLEFHKCYLLPELLFNLHILNGNLNLPGNNTVSSLLWFVGGGLSVGYDINNSISLLANAGFQNGLNDFSGDRADGRIKVSGYGMTLRYHLF